jgi:hypothetical protein
MTAVVQQVVPNVTPQQIIQSALAAIGGWSPGEPLDPNLETDAFQMLNDMLDMWSNEHLMVFYQSEIIQNIAGATNWTIGLNGGQINVQRPLRINYAFVRISTSLAGVIDFPVKVINLAQYYPIGLKQLPGAWARTLYYQPTMPLGTLEFWPLSAQGEIHIFADTQLVLFNTVNDNVVLPPGYNMALRWNLAELLMPSYGRNDAAIMAKVEKFAASSKRWVKRTNATPPPEAQFDIALLNRNGNNAAWIFDGGLSS